MLQPIHYKDIVEDIDEHLKQHYITVFKSRKRQHMINYNLWSDLDQEQKEELIEFIEKELANSIATQMMKGADRIPVPCLGAFQYSPAKEFRRTNKRKEDESEEESIFSAETSEDDELDDLEAIIKQAEASLSSKAKKANIIKKVIKKNNGKYAEE